jgi:MFS family permease
MSASSLANNRPFRLFWFGQAASNLGDAFGFVAMPLLVLEVTSSVVEMGRVTAVAAAGQLVAATFSGYVVDRVNRRHLMILCDAVRMLLYGSLPLALGLHRSSIAPIYVVAALAAVASNLFSVAYVAAIPNLVDTEAVPSANGRLQATQAVTYVVGAALAGAVCSRFGATWALGIDALSFVASLSSLASISFRRDRTEREDPRGNPLSDLWTGILFLVRHRSLRTLTLFQSAVALLGSIGLSAAVIDLIVYRLKTEFGASGRAVGVCLAFASIGAVAGAIGAARSRRRLSLGAIVVAGTTLQATGMLAAGLGRGVVAVTIGGGLWSAGLTFRAVGAMSLRQTATPDALLGRVVSAGWILIFGAAALGALFVTTLAARIGASHAAICIGGLLALVSAVGALSPLVEVPGQSHEEQKERAS